MTAKRETRNQFFLRIITEYAVTKRIFYDPRNSKSWDEILTWFQDNKSKIIAKSEFQKYLDEVAEAFFLEN